jgi:hypothetical protein
LSELVPITSRDEVGLLTLVAEHAAGHTCRPFAVAAPGARAMDGLGVARHPGGDVLKDLALVGVNRAVDRPMVVNGTIQIRRMMNLSSSFDHRFVDGYVLAEKKHGRFPRPLKNRVTSLMDMMKEANFFESKVTEYQKKSSLIPVSDDEL